MIDLIAEVPEIFLTNHDLDRFTQLLDKDIKPEGYELGLVALASINNLIWAVRAAAKSSEQAVSWRNYRVGAVAIAYNLEAPAMGIVVGANFKPDRTTGLNLHAEQIALAKARQHHLNKVMALAVWGDPNDENANPTKAPTLRPCRRCSDMFDIAPAVLPETFILGGNSDWSVCEFYTVKELSDYYKKSEATGPISETPCYSLADDMDDRRYEAEILATYLWPKVHNLYPSLGFGQNKRTLK